MRQALTKHLWIIHIVTLTIGAYFLARGTGALVASRIDADLPISQATARPATPPSGPTVIPPKGDATLQRNLFDAAMGPISRHPFAQPMDMPKPPLAPPAFSIVPCTSPLRLIATVAYEATPEWSTATVLADNAAQTYRVGDPLADRTVSGITWRYLFLRGRTDDCYVDMFEDPQSDGKKASSSTASPRHHSPPPSTDRIASVTPTGTVVARSVVDEFIADPTQILGSTTVRPHRQAGKVVGFKLEDYRKGSPLEKVGARKGDILRAVNGIDLTSIDTAVGAYTRLRSAHDLTFSIIRQGKPVELKVAIR